MAAQRETASAVRLPLLLDGGETGGRKWRIDLDAEGNLIFQAVGPSGQWETKKTLTKTGAWI
jgi:hypothetical protein